MSETKESVTRFTIILFTFLIYAQATQAHVHKGEAVSFLTGLKHPISGLDHVVAMIAVGLWGAQLGAPAIWKLALRPRQYSWVQPS